MEVPPLTLLPVFQLVTISLLLKPQQVPLLSALELPHAKLPTLMKDVVLSNRLQ
jgi:hypothetical protein